MKAGRGTIVLVLALVAVFGLELATDSVGNESALLRLGALPDSGHLDGQYWRLVTYAFLHFSWVHLLLNATFLWWIGRVVERRVGITQAAGIYASSMLSSAAAILLVRRTHPKVGATLGASGAIFGLLAAALVLVQRRDTPGFGREKRLRVWLWVALIAGLGASFLPGISLAGHVGGLACGAALGTIVGARGGVDRIAGGGE